MEALVKFTVEALSTKPDNQLRQILRREFSYIKGTSLMSSKQLIDKIIEFKDAKQKQIDDNSGVRLDMIHKDVVGNEWKVAKIENNLVYIENETGHKTNITIEAFKNTFQEMSYNKFSSNTLIQEVEEIVDEIEVPVKEPAQKEKATRTKSKSDLTRSIVREQLKGTEKVTSGTVMAELKKKHRMDIHRSFCSTLIKQVKDE